MRVLMIFLVCIVGCEDNRKMHRDVYPKTLVETAHAFEFCDGTVITKTKVATMGSCELIFKHDRGDYSFNRKWKLRLRFKDETNLTQVAVGGSGLLSGGNAQNNINHNSIIISAHYPVDSDKYINSIAVKKKFATLMKQQLINSYNKAVSEVNK